MKRQTHHLLHLLKKQLLCKHLLIASCLLFSTFSTISFAQPQQRIWATPGNQVKFTPATVASPLSTGYTYGGQPPYTTSNSMTDYNGNLLFYVLDIPSASLLYNDVMIYDKDGVVIDMLRFPSTGQTTTGLAGEIGLIPVPNSCAKYYIVVGVGNVGVKTPYHPEYAVLDMTKPNINDATRKGALVYYSPTVNTINLQDSDPSLNFAWDKPDRPGASGSPIYENNRFGMAISPLRTATNDYFLFISGITSIYRFVVKSNGIFLDVTASDLGIADAGLPQTHDNLVAYTEMELIPYGTGRYRMGRIDASSNVRVYDFNTTTGVYIPSTYREFSMRESFGTFVYYEGIGLEFASSGNKLYYSCFKHDGTGGVAIDTRQTGYFNLLATSPTPIIITIPAPPMADPTILDVPYIEKGFDGKIYYNYVSALLGNATPETGTWTNIPLSELTVHCLPDQLDGQDYKDKPIFVDYTAGTVGAYTYTTYASAAQVWTPTNNPFGGTAINPVGTTINPVIILGDLIIPQGFNITIQGMTFKFKGRTITYPSGVPTINYGARVVVKNATGTAIGGRLTLKNLGTQPTLFTSDNLCGTGMWEGIEVWGDNTQAQLLFATSKQGWLVMTSSTVENAYYGAYAGRKNAYYNFYLPNTQGGVILTNYATFRNNWNDVTFNPYNLVNSISSFRYTTFITDALLNEATGVTLYLAPVYHVYMNDTKNVQFKTCTFKNNVPLLYPIVTTNTFGIYSRNSQFFVVPAITSIYGIGISSSFENLRYGLYAVNAVAKTVTADQNVFKNCWRGTFLSNVTTPTFTRNKYFIYEQTAGTPASLASYGMYLDYCTGFKVTENKFYYNSHIEGAVNDVATQFNDFGCIINQSNASRRCATAGYGGDELYKNYFNEMFVGTQSQGDNSEPALNQSVVPFNNPCYDPILQPVASSTTPNNAGLKFLCNDYKGIDKNDIRVTDFSSGGISGTGATVFGNVSFQQGFTAVPAGNHFSHSICTSPDPLSDKEIFEDATPNLTTNPNYFQYVYHNNGSDPATYSTKPNCYSPYTGVLPLAGVDAQGSLTTYMTANTCLSKVSTSAIHLSKQQIAISKLAIITLNSLLEDGDNQTLINLIATGSNGAILTGLLAKSPLLSDRILIAALNKGLPAGNIRLIMLANSPVSKTVKAVLDAVTLPTGIRNQINSAQVGKSGRDLVIEQIGYSYSQKGYYSNEIVRYFLNDTINPNGLDSIIELAKTGAISLPDNSCTVVKSYLAKGDIAMATQSANDIQAIQGVNGECAYLFTLIGLENAYDGYEATKRDGLLKTGLENIGLDLTKDDYSSANAILKQIFNNPYEEWIEPFHAPRSMQQLPSENSMVTDAKSSYLTIYPNPANDFVYFDYQLPENVSQATVNVYNYVGKVVQSFTIFGSEGTATQNVSELANGLYMFSIVADNATIAQQKVVITK
jgi:Secretion system C-terminal sorting domain